MQLTTYLFDLDGTLIDMRIYEKLYLPLLEKIRYKLDLTQEGLDIKAEQLNIKKASHKRYDTGELCKALGLLDLYYEGLEKAINKENIIRNNTKDTLKRLKQDNKTIGIISNSMKKTILLYMDKCDLTRYIDFIFCPEDTKDNIKKDNPKFWKELIKKHDLDPKECMIIGDNPIDDISIPDILNFNTRLLKDTT